VKDKSHRMMEEEDLIGMAIVDGFAIKLLRPSQENMAMENLISN